MKSPTFRHKHLRIAEGNHLSHGERHEKIVLPLNNVRPERTDASAAVREWTGLTRGGLVTNCFLLNCHASRLSLCSDITIVQSMRYSEAAKSSEYIECVTRFQGFPNVKMFSARTIRYLLSGACSCFNRWVLSSSSGTLQVTLYYIFVYGLTFVDDGASVVIPSGLIYRNKILLRLSETHSEEERTTKKTIFTLKRILDTHHHARYEKSTYD
uniref:Uncharacterized protein n=1 Tax=Glossina austeni TaxID=7395 RepID=A0A1A9UE44_GLOAU